MKLRETCDLCGKKKMRWNITDSNNGSIIIARVPALRYSSFLKISKLCKSCRGTITNVRNKYTDTDLINDSIMVTFL